MMGDRVQRRRSSSRQGGGGRWRGNDAGEVHDVLWGEWTEEEEDVEERKRVACDAAASVTRTLAARRRGLCVAALVPGEEGTEGKGVCKYTS